MRRRGFTNVVLIDFPMLGLNMFVKNSCLQVVVQSILVHRNLFGSADTCCFFLNLALTLFVGYWNEGLTP